MSTINPTPRDILTEANNRRLQRERLLDIEREKNAKLRSDDVSRMASIEGSPEYFVAHGDDEAVNQADDACV